MTNDEMTFLDTQTNRQALKAKRVFTSGVHRRAQREKVRVCASSEVLVCTPSRSWQLPLSGHETARKSQDYKWRFSLS